MAPEEDVDRGEDGAWGGETGRVAVSWGGREFPSGFAGAWALLYDATVEVRSFSFFPF